MIQELVSLYVSYHTERLAVYLSQITIKDVTFVEKNYSYDFMTFLCRYLGGDIKGLVG